MGMLIPKKGTCPGCGHTRHRTECTVRLPWWRRWVLEFCHCTYWDSRWENRQALGDRPVPSDAMLATPSEGD